METFLAFLDMTMARAMLGCDLKEQTARKYLELRYTHGLELKMH